MRLNRLSCGACNLKVDSLCSFCFTLFQMAFLEDAVMGLELGDVLLTPKFDVCNLLLLVLMHGNAGALWNLLHAAV